MYEIDGRIDRSAQGSGRKVFLGLWTTRGVGFRWLQFIRFWLTVLLSLTAIGVSV